MQVLTILDQEKATVLIFPFDKRLFRDEIEFIYRLEEDKVISNASKCEWMLTKSICVRVFDPD